MTHLVFWHSRVDSHRAELVLVRIVSNLPKVVSSAGPELPAISFLHVVGEEQSVVLAAGDLEDRHALQSIFHLSWLCDSISVSVTQAQLALVRISAPEDFILIGDED